MKTLLAILVIPSLLFAASEDSTSTPSTISLQPLLARITAEASTAFFVSGYSATVDFDFVEIVRGGQTTLGLRFVGTKFYKGRVGEPSDDDRFVQIVDALTACTLRDNKHRLNVFIGYSQVKDFTQPSPTTYSYIKWGVEGNIFFLPPVAAFFLRIERYRDFGTVSVGLSIGYFH